LVFAALLALLVFSSFPWHVGWVAMGIWARHGRFAYNEAQRNDPPPSATNIICRVAPGVALGVQRDVPGKRRVLGARVLRFPGLARPSFAQRLVSFILPGRLDMLARVGLTPRSRVGDFMPDGGDPLTGWLAGCPGGGAANAGNKCCAMATGRTPCATPTRSKFILW